MKIIVQKFTDALCIYRIHSYLENLRDPRNNRRNIIFNAKIFVHQYSITASLVLYGLEQHRTGNLQIANFQRSFSFNAPAPSLEWLNNFLIKTKLCSSYKSELQPICLVQISRLLDGVSALGQVLNKCERISTRLSCSLSKRADE